MHPHRAGSFETAIWYRKENVAAAANDPDSPNIQRTAAYRNYIMKQVQRRDPTEVARLIARVAADPHPRLRYTIGPDAKLLLLLRALLPFKLFESMVARKLQLGG